MSASVLVVSVVSASLVSVVSVWPVCLLALLVDLVLVSLANCLYFYSVYARFIEAVLHCIRSTCVFG